MTQTSKENIIEALETSGFIVEMVGTSLRVEGVDSPNEYLVFDFDEEDYITNISGNISND